MDLKRSGLLYKFVYAWANNPPALQTDWFRLPLRCVVSLFIGWPIVVPLAFLIDAKVPTRSGLKTWSKWTGFTDLKSPFSLLATLLFLGATIWGMVMVPLLIFKIRSLQTAGELMGGIVVLGLVGWLFVAIAGPVFFIAWLNKWLHKKYAERKSARTNLRAKNILWEYLRTKKAKVFPVIRIV